MLVFKVAGWIGTVLALAVTFVTLLAVFSALAWSAFEPAVREIIEEIKKGRP